MQIDQIVHSHEFIIFGVGNYNALGIVRSLGKIGIKSTLCILKTDRKRNLVATKSKYIKDVYYCLTLEEGLSWIKSNFIGSNKTFILTNDDKAQSLIDRDYFNLKSDFYVFNAGNPGNIIHYMDKKNILDLAEKHGLKVAKTQVVPRGIIPDNIEFPIITKSISPLVGGWKADVKICDNRDQLEQACSNEIKADTILIQKYIDKKNEWCLDGISTLKGTKPFTPLFSKYNYNIKGYYSPYMTVTGMGDFSEKEWYCYKKVAEMLEDIGYEGVYSAEFLIDQDGEYYFSEINFRNSTWSYMASLLDMDLIYLYALSQIYGDINIEKYYQLIPEKYTAIVEPIDYQKRVIERGYSRFKWFKDLLKSNCKFYWDLKDIKPWLYMFLHNKEFR